MSVSRFQRLVVVDEHAFERGHARLGQYGQRKVAQMAVVALVENVRHRIEGSTETGIAYGARPAAKGRAP